MSDSADGKLVLKRSFRGRRDPSLGRPRTSLLRRISIGPRLWLFLALPAAVLVGLIGLLVWTDVETTDELRGFTVNTAGVMMSETV